MIPVAEPWLTDQELKYVTDAVDRGWISPKGDYVTKFENAFASFVETEHAHATSTGTAALHLCLVAADIGPGDEVIVPDLTWISCANVVHYVGATPVFADIDKETYNIDPDSLRECVTEDTAAVMPVHLYGLPCNMTEIITISEEYDLFVIEDAAEAHGATYGGKPVGSIGDVGCFSFYGNKTLTTGQGGMITTDDDTISERIRLYRHDGMSTEYKYYHTVIGYNYRLTNIQAAIGLAQVERAKDILAEKRRVANVYRRELSGSSFRFQAEPDPSVSSHWMNAPVFDTVAQRERVEQSLSEQDIQSRPFFVPIHKQPPYESSDSGCPVATDIAKRGLNLPSSPLLSNETISRVCNIIDSSL